jgi:membrane protein
MIIERRQNERRYQPAPPRRDETFGEAVRDFIRRVYIKADQDGIFFMSGAIAFNLIVAIVPLMLAVLGITGVMLQNRVEDPSKLLADYIFQALPPAGPEFQKFIEDDIIKGLLSKSGGFIGFGLIVLVWVSTRLVGTLRFTLREVFDIGEDRNIIRGKWFDVQMVVAAGTLFAVNAAATVIINIITRTGITLLGVHPTEWFQKYLLSAVAALSIWAMFVLVYRTLPFRRPHWRTALVAATFTSIVFELLKRAFAWYALNIAEYSSTYGNFLNLVILVFWMYYIALAFVLGGEVGQVYALRRVRKRQKERLV